MKSAEEWHSEFEQADIADLINQYGGVPGFIRAIQTDTIKAAAEKLHTVPRMIKFGNLADHVRAASAGDYEAVILSLIPEA